MAENPLVSIIICTHNRAKLLKETVASVLAQRYSPAECIVIDDGSADNTSEVVKEFGNDVRYFRHQNKGMEATLNAACKELARGEYIAINDDDDLMRPERISILHEALCRFPQAVLAVGDAEMIDAGGNPTGIINSHKINFESRGPVLIADSYKALLWPLISPATCSTLFRRADGERAGWYDEKFTRCSDTDFFGRLALMGPIVYVPQVVSYYRRGHVSKWGNGNANNIICEYNNYRLFKKHLTLANIPREMEKRLRTRMLHTMKRLALLVSQTEGRPGVLRDNRLQGGQEVLDFKKRLEYKWYINFKLPLRNAVRRAFCL